MHNTLRLWTEKITYKERGADDAKYGSHTSAKIINAFPTQKHVKLLCAYWLPTINFPAEILTVFTRLFEAVTLWVLIIFSPRVSLRDLHVPTAPLQNNTPFPHSLSWHVIISWKHFNRGMSRWCLNSRVFAEFLPKLVSLAVMDHPKWSSAAVRGGQFQMNQLPIVTPQRELRRQLCSKATIGWGVGLNLRFRIQRKLKFLFLTLCKNEDENGVKHATFAFLHDFFSQQWNGTQKFEIFLEFTFRSQITLWFTSLWTLQELTILLFRCHKSEHN